MSDSHPIADSGFSIAYVRDGPLKDRMMTLEEQIRGRRLSRPGLIAVRFAEAIFIGLSLFYLGGALHDALHPH